MEKLEAGVKESKLKVEVKDDELIIRIGISTLAYATIMEPYRRMELEEHGEVLKITDERVFVESVKTALMEEIEDGTTLLQQLTNRRFL